MSPFIKPHVVASVIGAFALQDRGTILITWFFNLDLPQSEIGLQRVSYHR